MQDEIIKHSEKIFKTVKNKESSFWEKFREVLLEIFIIVFAVTLSIWLHNWSEHHHQSQEARDFLKDMRDDLSKDLDAMTSKSKNLKALDSAYASILNMTARQLDTAKNLSLSFTFNSFKANAGNYEGFKSSGKIGFIEDADLKKMILSYYEQDLPTLYDVDKYQYGKHLEVWEALNSLDEKKLFSNPVLRAKIVLDDQITEASGKAYDFAIQKARRIQQAISQNIKE